MFINTPSQLTEKLLELYPDEMKSERIEKAILLRLAEKLSQTQFTFICAIMYKNGNWENIKRTLLEVKKNFINATATKQEPIYKLKIFDDYMENIERMGGERQYDYSLSR